MTEIESLLYVVPGILGILCSCFIVVTYLSFKELRKHPSGLIVLLGVFEIVMVYHTIVLALDVEDFARAVSIELLEEDTELLCKTNALLLTIGVVGSLCCNIAICLDLIVSLWNPFASPKKRMVVYIVVIALAIAYFTIYTVINHKNFTDSCAIGNEQLLIYNEGMLQFLAAAFLLVGTTSVIYAVFRLRRGLHLQTEFTKKYLKTHIFYVVMFFIQWLFAGLSWFGKHFSFPHEWAIKPAMVTISLSGVFSASVRMFDKAFRKKLKELFYFTIQDYEDKDSLDLPISSLVFGNLSLELTHCLFASLHGVFKENTKCSYEASGQFTEFTFSKVKRHSLGKYILETSELWGIQTSKIGSVTIKEYAPDVFQEIRMLDLLCLEAVLRSLDPATNKESIFRVEESKGKSGSFFLFTSNSLLTIKIIKEKEKTQMLKFLEGYYLHLKRNPKSLLCRVYGLFRMKALGIAPIDIMVMKNVLYNFEPSRTYDLKGSTKGRTSMRNGVAIGPLKDMDFIKMNEKISIGKAESEELFKRVILDVQLLRKYKFIDYSMLIGIGKFKQGKNTYHSTAGNRSYRLGIIDFLTNYGYRKRLEKALSSQKASVKDPQTYANRFFNFLFSKAIPVIQPKCSFTVNWSSFALIN